MQAGGAFGGGVLAVDAGVVLAAELVVGEDTVEAGAVDAGVACGFCGETKG